MRFPLLEFLIFSEYIKVNKAEQLKGSIGVIIDDIVAGIYALIIFYFIKFLYPYEQKEINFTEK